jgi:hypothetical protein
VNRLKATLDEPPKTKINAILFPLSIVGLSGTAPRHCPDSENSKNFLQIPIRKITMISGGYQ